VFEQWEPGQAIVIDTKDITGNANGTTRRHAYVLEAQPADGQASFRAEDNDPLIVRDDFAAPKAGELVDVDVDWKQKEIRLIRDAPGRKKDPLAGARAQDASFAASLTGTSAATPQQGRPTLTIGPNVHIIMDPSRVHIDPSMKVTIDPSAVIETTPPEAAAGSAAVGGISAQIASLEALHQQGVLSDVQFEQAKNAVIGLTGK
jgi:hypothetical protein